MNGCSLQMILLPCLLEIAVVLAPAVFVRHMSFKRCGYRKANAAEGLGIGGEEYDPDK